MERSFPKRYRKEEKKSDGKTLHSAMNRRSRHWRLIVRNLNFNTSEEQLREKFAAIGTVLEIVLPKCKDKRFPYSCAGFGFVQYGQKEAAERAMQMLNGSELQGRVMAVDWTIPKDNYETIVHNEKNMKECKMEMKQELEEEEEQEEDIDVEEEEEEEEIETLIQKKKKPDASLEEGRTIFVRNLSFDTADDELKSRFESFGALELAIICKYPGTEHSKGSAFLSFSERKAADECLQKLEQEDGIMLGGRRIHGHRAVNRKVAADLAKSRLEKTPKDGRNLHLLRVGFIRPGTSEALNMSEADAKRRETLELSARQKIKNMNMFVSPTRLIVHNLSAKVDDRKLRSICWMACNDVDAKISECRIWRDMNRLNAQGVGHSHGYGFLNFDSHKNALKCLKALNNNPKTFTNVKRPIVEFSIENKIALNRKRTRMEKSNRKDDDATTTKKRQKSDLDKTKIEMAAGGKKPLPSHTGPKIRHRDRKATMKKSNIAAKKSANNPKVGKRSATKSTKKKNALKFLALN